MRGKILKSIIADVHALIVTIEQVETFNVEVKLQTFAEAKSTRKPKIRGGVVRTEK